MAEIGQKMEPRNCLKSVVKTVVTQKQGLSILYHSKNSISYIYGGIILKKSIFSFSLIYKENSDFKYISIS